MKINKVYIAGPMTGLPYFNKDAFFAAEAALAGEGFHTFNPAAYDLQVNGEDFFEKCPDGTLEQAEAQGFSIRKALAVDLLYICQEATHIYMLKGWEKSYGSKAEHATAVAIGLEIMYEH